MFHIKITISPMTAELPLSLALPFSATAELPLSAPYHSQRHKGLRVHYMLHIKSTIQSKISQNKSTVNKTLSDQYPIAYPYSIIVFKGQWGENGDY